MKLRNGDMIRLSPGVASVTAPAWIMPGQAADCVVALLGSGRRVGSVASGAGIDFYPLTGRADALSLEKIKRRADLACTDHHNLIFDEAGEYVRHGTLAEYGKDPQFLAIGDPEPQLYRWKPEGPAAMPLSKPTKNRGSMRANGSNRPANHGRSSARFSTFSETKATKPFDHVVMLVILGTAG